MSLLLSYAIGTIYQIEQHAWAFPVGVALELLFARSPLRPAQRLKGAALWTLYFLATGAFIAVDGYLFRLIGLKPLFSVGPGSPWIVPAVIAAAFASDFFYYWCHRLQHTPLLWRFHAVHHSIRDMSALNSFHHWTEEPIHFFMLGIPMALLLQPTGPLQQAASAFIVLQTVYIHTQTKLHFGPLSGVLVDNRFHRHHHIIDEERSGMNFGVFTTLWDVVFGTAYFPTKDEWCEVGLRSRPEVTELRDFLFPKRA